MLSPRFPFAPEALPRLGQPERAAAGLERWREAAPAGLARRLIDDADGRALLSAVFANSPFLGRCLIGEPTILPSLLADGAEAVLGELLARVAGEVAQERDAARVMRGLRRARRQAALVIGLADIAGVWSLERATAALSAFADAAIGAACRHLLRAAAEGGDLKLPDPAAPERGSGLVVIAMGKLGAGELNYSSDIDLIVLYERDGVDYRGRPSLPEFYVRLARALVRFLEEPTGDGYVFRTDLRLRPDPGSTPLALSVRAAETYYEGMGQNWERAAMIKARAAAGDLGAGKRFLAALRPFVWRKHLDFAAIQDIHSIKRQIHAVKGFHDIAVAGHNIKLGRGGIREIEFFAQTQQLIWGGRQPELRQAGTCAAIEALVGAGRVGEGVARELIAAYRHLRHVEHRLQMIDDRQTQTLPETGPELDALAAFAGAPSTEAFVETLWHHLARVEEHYAALFEEAPSLGGPGSLVFTGTEDDPDTVKTLESMGYADGGRVSEVVRGWHFGRYRAMRSARARELLTEIMPALLEALAKSADPDAAFARFDEFLGRLPAGVQFLSLLYQNPGLLNLIAEIMGGAPRLADRLSRNPALLDAVLSRGFFDPLPPIAVLAEDLRRTLADARDFEDVLDFSRRWARDRQFQQGVRILRNVGDGDAAGGPLSDIAETVLAAIHPHVEAEFRKVHGRLPGDGLAVVALGKLGGREMTVASDLDLIFVYDAPELPGGWDHALSDGAKPLAPIHYYARLAQRFINALTAPTAEGKLYDIDMRLRPSGANGPIASSLAGFRRYQEEDAWTWEHMALLRARVVSGAPGLSRAIERVVGDVLSRQRDPRRLLADVAEMRRRIAQSHAGHGTWDVKHRRGGLIDAEFVAQFLLLAHAAGRPRLLRRNTADAFAALAEGGVLEPAAAAALIAAVGLWRRVQGMLRLTAGEAFDEAQLPEVLRQALAAAGRAPDFAALKRDMTEAALAVRAQYERFIEAPAQALAG